jgi:hypothetical protein
MTQNPNVNSASSLMLSNGGQILVSPHSDSSFENDHIDPNQIASNRISTPETTITTLPEITNSDFMEAIFVDLLPDERPMVAEVYGDEIIKNPSFSGAKGWARGHDFGSGNVNHYFTLSTYHPDDSTYKRTKNQFYRAFGIYFDDIGTKGSSFERLNTCRPSYVIETSSRNYQAGYLFEKPVENLAQVEDLLNAAVQSGLGDPGAKGPSSRLGRLPCAINGKYEPFFQCKIVEWHPERRYTIDQIYQGLALEKVESAIKASIVNSGSATASQATSVYSPRTFENPVISALRLKGLYKHLLGAGRHEITCPWVHDHTGRIDSGTAYFEPAEQFSYGAFKCFHGHCAERKLTDFLKEVDVSFEDAKHKATITVIAGELDGVVDAAETELSITGKYYQRAGSICHVINDPGSNLTAIKAVNPSDLTRALSKEVHWRRYSIPAQSFTTIDPSSKHVNSLHSSGSYKHLPVLQGIARQPYLRSDNSLMLSAGYDASTGMYGVFDESKFSVPMSPSREVAIAALNELKSLLSEFSFAKPHDLAAAIAMMITAAIRTSLPLALMGHIKAPQISSGKSYLCDLIGAFAGPARPAAYAFPPNDEECTKLLLAALYESPAVITFDNLTSDLLPFKSLCSALTSEHMTGRTLGVSQTRTVSTRTLFLSSGNNVDPVRDLVRRVLTIMLDPQLESPATRRFNKNPLAMVLANREQYVSLILTIVRAYIVAGCPIQNNLTALGSYGEWSKLVRSPLVWLGLPDPATALFGTMETDPDREILGRLLMNVYRFFGDNPVSIREIVYRVENNIQSGLDTDLSEVVREISEQYGKINSRTLGRWISRHKDRIVNGYYFSRSTKSGGSERWQVILKVPLKLEINTAIAGQLSDDRFSEAV